MSLNNRRKVKIGLVLSQVPGYSETFFRNKIKGLQADGFEVLLFVDYDQEAAVDISANVIVAPNFNCGIIKRILIAVLIFFKVLILTPQRSFRLYQLDSADGISLKLRFKQLIRNQFLLKHDINWLHFGFGMLATGRENVAQAIGSKMAVSFRGFDFYLSPLKHPGCYDILFKKVITYHVLSKGMKDRLSKTVQCKSQIYVITPAIDTHFFQTKKRELSPIKNKIQIITVARLHWIKGLDYTLEALALLKKKGFDFKYTVIGEGHDLERLLFTANQLGISEQVTFTGKLASIDVKNYLEQSDIYLQYSIQEGFCNAALEAQAMGLLCIVSDAEGLKENVLDRLTGWVVPRRQPEALTKKIIEVINLSLTERQLISDAAIVRVKGTFNLEQQRQSFREFYNNL